MKQQELLVADGGSKGGRTADCYAAGDRRMMDWWKELRARRLAPVLRGLGRLGATADRVTLLGLVSGLGFCALWPISPPLALLSLAIHLAWCTAQWMYRGFPVVTVRTQESHILPFQGVAPLFFRFVSIAIKGIKHPIQ